VTHRNCISPYIFPISPLYLPDQALLGSCVTHRNFIRFNLSEYSHVSKFNRLTGGDPNYVGYKGCP